MAELKYTPAFRTVYRLCGSSLPIDTWYTMVGKHLSVFRNPTNAFLPITLNVAVANRADTPAVRINVNPNDSEWYSKLTDALKEMCGIKGSVSVRTYMGTPIDSMTHQQLRSAGQLHIVNAKHGTQLFSVANEVTSPPKYMAADKLRDITLWHQDELRDGVADVVADALGEKSMQEINAAMTRDGPVQRKIADYIKSTVPEWSAFVATYARDDVARQANAENGGDSVAMAISRGYLQQVRAAIRANTPHVSAYFAQREAQQLMGAKTDDAPLFTQHVATSVSKFADARVMWKEIAEDAMYHGRTARIPIAALYDGHQRICCYTPDDKKKKKKARRNVNTNVESPLVRLQVKSSVEGAYPGDSVRAVQMFHLFSGSAAPAVPPMPALVPIEDEMPRLVPLESLGKEMPRLVPLESEEVVMPELVDVGKRARRTKRKTKKKGKAKYHVYMNDEVDPLASYDLEEPLFESGYDDAPNLEDFL